MKKALKVVVALLAVVIAAAAGAFLLVDPQAFLAKKKDEATAQVSARLGRTLTVGPMSAQVFPSLRARVEGVKLAGPAGSDRPQAEIHSLDVKLDLVKALLTFGQVLEVEHVVVNGLALRAARDRDGRWDFDDVLRTLEETSEKSEDDAPTDLSFLKGARLARFSIHNSRIDLDDAALGGPLSATGLRVDVSDVVLGKPLVASLSAVLEDGARKSPISLYARLAELPETLSFDPLPDASVDVKLQDVDVGRWGVVVPSDAPGPAAGIVRADLRAEAKDGGKRIDAQGTLFLRGLVLRDAVSALATSAERAAAKRGAPLDADVDFALSLDAAAPRYRIEKLVVKGGGMDVTGTLDAQGTGPADLVAADVKAEIQDLGRVLAFLPPSLAALPPEVKIEGPLSAKLAGSASEVTAALSLDRARVRYDTSFDKPAGRPLNVALHGVRKDQVLHVDQLALVVDTAKIGGTLDIPVQKGAPLQADIHSGPIALSSLQGIVPPFKEALGSGRKVDGVLEVKAKAGAAGGRQLADVAVEMRGMDVNLARTTARGSGALRLKAEPAGSVVKLVVQGDLDGVAVKSVDESGAVVLDKPAGVPLRLDVDVAKGDARADIQSARLAVGKSAVTAKGAVTGLDGDSPALDVDLGNVDVAFDDVRAAVPGAQSLPAGGRLKGAVRIKGAPEALSTLVVEASGLDVTFGRSRLAGKAVVKNLDAPVLDVDLPTVQIAFDDVRGLSESAADLPAGGRFGGSLTMKGDTARDETVQVGVKIGLLEVPGSRIKGDVALQGLDKPRFTVDLAADELDLDRLQEVGGGGGDGGSSSSKDDNPHGLSKSTREMLAKVSGTGTLKAERAVVQTVPVKKFVGKLTMTRGVLKFDTLDFDLYGGRVSATGSVLDLPAQATGYELHLKMTDIDVGQALAAHTSLRGVLGGRVSPELDVKGRGLAWSDFAHTLEGPAVFSASALTIETLDLLGPIAAPLREATKAAGTFTVSSAPQRRGTKLRDLNAFTIFHGGKMTLKQPLHVDTEHGKLSLDGAAFLDKRLDFKATLDVTPEAVAGLTGGKVKLKAPVPVPFKIGGTWDKPVVTGVDVTTLARALVGDAAGKAVDSAVDAIAEKVGVDVPGGGAQGAAAAANDAKKKAEEETKRRAEEEKKRVEAEAKKKADAAKKKAEEEAKRAKKKAEDEAKKALGGIFGK